MISALEYGTANLVSGMRNVNIHIGEFHASKKPVIIETLLGSCVAVCLYDPVEKIGGMNHILLPGKADLGQFDTMSRYGVNAMELLINRIMKLGGGRNTLTAKVFGGAHVVPTISKANGVGRRNVRFVLKFLEMEGIPILSKDLGGRDTRRIFFHTDTGEVLLKRIPFTAVPWVSLQERKVWEQIRTQAEETGDIILFE